MSIDEKKLVQKGDLKRVIVSCVDFAQINALKMYCHLPLITLRDAFSTKDKRTFREKHGQYLL